jgi:hypothetical protein
MSDTDDKARVLDIFCLLLGYAVEGGMDEDTAERIDNDLGWALADLDAAKHSDLLRAIQGIVGSSDPFASCVPSVN